MHASLTAPAVIVSWTCKTFQCLHTAWFATQDEALAFVAGAPRDTAYALEHGQ